MVLRMPWHPKAIHCFPESKCTKQIIVSDLLLECFLAHSAILDKGPFWNFFQMIFVSLCDSIRPQMGREQNQSNTDNTFGCHSLGGMFENRSIQCTTGSSWGGCGDRLLPYCGAKPFPRQSRGAFRVIFSKCGSILDHWGSTFPPNCNLAEFKFCRHSCVRFWRCGASRAGGSGVQNGGVSLRCPG